MSTLKSMVIMGIMVSVSMSDTFKCTTLGDVGTQELLPIASTVSIAGNKASVNIDGIGSFSYRYQLKSPMGLMVYDGVDNGGYLSYSKLDPDIMILSNTTAISGCKRITK